MLFVVPTASSGASYDVPNPLRVDRKHSLRRLGEKQDRK